MNFLYCFDKNYNIQAYVSIFSLLENVNEKINIYIIHKEPEKFKKYKKKILRHEKLNELHIEKFVNVFEFPGLFEAHVSEATYYRLFIEDYIPKNVEHLIYMDADTVVINPVYKDIYDLKNKLINSDNVISVKTEKDLSDSTKRLGLNNGKYFNAGVMIIDFNKWVDNKLSEKLIERMESIKSQILFWDQDVLNSYFDGKYQELDEIYNYKIDVDDKSQKKCDRSDAMIIHYVGKSKPWTVRGSIKENSRFYQTIYESLFMLPYHISNNWKQQAFDDLITYTKTGVVKNVRKPIGFVISVLYFLLKKRAK